MCTWHVQETAQRLELSEQERERRRRRGQRDHGQGSLETIRRTFTFSLREMGDPWSVMSKGMIRAFSMSKGNVEHTRYVEHRGESREAS